MTFGGTEGVTLASEIFSEGTLSVLTNGTGGVACGGMLDDIS